MCLYKRLSESPCLCITALLTISNVATHFNVNCVIRFSFMLCVMLVSAVCAWLICCPILSLTQTQTGHSQKRKLRLMPQCCPNPACAVRASKTDGGFFSLFFYRGCWEVRMMWTCWASSLFGTTSKTNILHW